jgi:hypothetical protein
MILVRRKNKNGSYGKCSSKSLSDFAVWDRVVLVLSLTGIAQIGATGTVVGYRYNKNLLAVNWDGLNNQNLLGVVPVRPAQVRKIPKDT